jgi:hypothetical protein
MSCKQVLVASSEREKLTAFVLLTEATMTELPDPLKPPVRASLRTVTSFEADLIAELAKERNVA